MKKLLLLLLTLSFSMVAFAQCKSKEEVNNMPTIYSKGYEESYMPTPEQEKILTGIFISAIEPALKSTKGLKGDWKPMGVLKETPLISQDGLAKSEIEMFLNLMSCKNNKIYETHETGLILKFYLNSLPVVTIRCEHEESRMGRKKPEDVKVYDQLDGKQIYCLYKPTESEKYTNIVFFRQTDDARYFIIAKPGVRLFVPLTVKQALEINKSNCLKKIEALKLILLSPDLQPATRSDYEKNMAKDFATFRSTYPNPEKFISDLITELEKTKKDGIKGTQNLIAFYTKSLNVVNDYLKTAPSEELEKPLISGTGFLNSAYSSLDDEQTGLKTMIWDANRQGNYFTYVTLDPAYFNNTISKSAPQLITVELRIQGNSAVALKAFKAFDANLNFNKLQQLLVK